MKLWALSAVEIMGESAGGVISSIGVAKESLAASISK
jgi:hypothetical protein